MENGIVRRISLKGSLRGSALLREYGSKTTVELSVRGALDGARLFTVGDGRIVMTPVSSNRLTVEQIGVCAAVIARNGSLLSGGFTGDCAKDRKRLLDEIRIRSAETAPPAAGEAPPPEKKPEAKPRAAVTGNILERAQRLFSMLEGLEAMERETAPSSDEKSGFTVVPNPFPKTFPGSVWRKKEGDMRLFGTVPIGGTVREYVAVPIDLKGGTARIRNARPIIGRDGRRFLVEVTE